MRASAEQDPWRARFEDFARHLADLRDASYEGAQSREEREALFRAGFDLVTPVATRVLSDIDEHFLGRTGDVTTEPPARDADGGLTGRWVLSWPAQRAAMDEHVGTPLEPIALVAVFQPGFTHPHLMDPRPGYPIHVVAWPFQVVDAADAARQEPVFRVLAEALLHERVYQSDVNWELCHERAWSRLLEARGAPKEERA
jgi:hypothetical protein